MFEEHNDKPQSDEKNFANEILDDTVAFVQDNIVIDDGFSIVMMIGCAIVAVFILALLWEFLTVLWIFAKFLVCLSLSVFASIKLYKLLRGMRTDV